MPKDIDKLLKDKSGIRLDVGGGNNPNPGFVNIDILPLPMVDIVHNIEITPWPLPAECAITVTASHLLEHINPTAGDARIQPLVELLVSKKLITQAEADKAVGEPGPAFIRVMNEIWRILKPGGQFAFVVPHASSHGYQQDPTHINMLNETTLHYFDPDPENKTMGPALYNFYKPKPWRIVQQYYSPQANLEVLLEKRAWDKSFAGTDDLIVDITKEKR